MSPARRKQLTSITRHARPGYLVAFAASLILSPTLFNSAVHKVLGVFERITSLEHRVISLEHENEVQNARVLAIEHRGP